EGSAAGEGREVLDGAVGDAGELVGGVEHQQGIVAAQVGRRDQGPVHWALPAPGPATPSRTAACPATSVPRTRTTSCCDAARLLPTYSGRIGSTRWPPSASTPTFPPRSPPRSST